MALSPPTGYTPLPVSPLLISLDPKHHPHHRLYVYNDCPDGWKFDDNIINNNITTTDDSQPSIFFDDDPPNAFLPYPLLLQQHLT